MIKIAVTGPESSGKTTLARQLSAYFDAPCVPEYARIYLALLGRPYAKSDLTAIARGQARWEDTLAALHPPLLICDTDMLVLKVWSAFKYGDCDPALADILAQQRYDLHLLCRPDMPWTYDPLREHPQQREELYLMYKEELQRAGALFMEVAGDEQQRLHVAAAFVRELMERKF